MIENFVICFVFYLNVFSVAPCKYKSYLLQIIERLQHLQKHENNHTPNPCLAMTSS